MYRIGENGGAVGEQPTHDLEDVLGGVAVLVVGVTLQFSDWPGLDPLPSITFTLFILCHDCDIGHTTIGLEQADETCRHG